MAETDIKQLTENTRSQFNILFGNMFKFDPEDMVAYDACYADVFSRPIDFSFMSATFFAQFSAEILVGMLASNPFRKFLTAAIDEEKGADMNGRERWEETMKIARFGVDGHDYTQDMIDLRVMMNTSYDKIDSLNNWFGTDEGKKEFDMYCLSRKALRDIKRVACEYPYLIRKFDYDEQFAGEIMEYAGIVAEQILQASEGGR